MTGCVVFLKVIEVPHHTQKWAKLSDPETPNLTVGPLDPQNLLSLIEGARMENVRSPILIKNYRVCFVTYFWRGCVASYILRSSYSDSHGCPDIEIEDQRQLHMYEHMET